jgi:4-oxalocrotonate tautomerase
VEVTLFEQELTKKQKENLIAKMTDAVMSVTSEKLRAATWVLVTEIPSGNWGVGGKALGLEDVKQLVGGD